LSFGKSAGLFGSKSPLVVLGCESLLDTGDGLALHVEGRPLSLGCTPDETAVLSLQAYIERIEAGVGEAVGDGKAADNS
jgi:hypothetical protein